jgi:formamidopyrimidine-DNA glycosylase
MPELPEVESIRRQLEPLITGKTIIKGHSFPSKKFSQAKLASGFDVLSVKRRGKYLLVNLEKESGGRSKLKELIIHLGMTGSVSIVEEKPDDPYVRAQWELDDGRTLLFRDIRRFGRIAFVNPNDYKSLPTLNNIGPEPFDSKLTAANFHKSLSSSKSHIKTKLLSQRIIAGLGNIYVDESLWRSHINPIARRIGKERSESLLFSIREVLSEAIKNGGTTFRDYRTPDGLTGKNQHNLDCYGRAGEACNACSSILKNRVVGQRSTTWCPKCQVS